MVVCMRLSLTWSWDMQVLSAITSCSSLTRLDLADSGLTNSDLTGLSGVLKQTTALTHLDLCANEMSGGNGKSVMMEHI